MSLPLFRKEALAARRGDAMGGIALTRPLATRWLAGAAVVSAVLVVLFLVLAPYTRRASVSGHLVPTRGLATVVAPMRGQVTAMQVEEGATVRAGQALLQLALPLATLDGGDAIAGLQARLRERQAGLEAGHVARAHVLQRKAEGLRVQRDAAREEQLQISAEVAARRRQLAIARQSLARLQRLHEQGFVSAMQLEQQQSTVLEHTSQVQAMQRIGAGNARAVAQLEQALAELPDQGLADDADYQLAQAQLAQEQLETGARGGQAVKAPVEGRVTSQLVKAGQAVEAGQVLLSVLPSEAALEAELWVPSRSIGFVAPGDKVMLRYHAYPYQKFGHQQGTVRQVGRSALGQREVQSLAGTAGSAEPHYRVIVALRQQSVLAYGKPEALRPGMLLEADILGERRRLVEWIFEPLYSVQGRVGVPL